jgi:hypothetical protein
MPTLVDEGTRANHASGGECGHGTRQDISSSGSTIIMSGVPFSLSSNPN